MINRLTRYRLAIIGLMIVWIGLFSEALGAIGKQPPFMFRHLTSSDGLINNSITALYRDSNGYLWVGTSAGLNRYDSYHFLPFINFAGQPRNNHIQSIFEDWDGHIWAESQTGYSYFDYKTDRFNENIDAFLQSINIPSDSIIKIGVSDKRDLLWAYNKQSLFIYNKRQDTTKKIALANGDISEIYVADEYLYIMFHSGRLIAIDVNTLSQQEIPIPEKYVASIAGETPYIYVDHSTGLWVHTYQNSKLFYKKNPSSDWEEIILSDVQNIFNRVRAVTEDGNGNIWIITSHLGAFVLKPGSGNIIRLVNDPLQSHTIASDNLTAIHSDKDGIVWLGTFKKGISYFSPHAQVILSHRLMPYSDIISFHEDNNAIWLGSDGGGLMKLMSDNIVTKVPVEANVIQTIKSDAKGCLWLGTFQTGLFKYDHGRVEHYTTTNSGLSSNIIYDLFFDNEGHLWLATLGGTIQKVDTQTMKFETVYNGNLNIRSMAYNGKDSLFAATSKGLLSLDLKTGKQSMLFPENIAIITMYKDSRDIVWMGNAEGLSFIDLKTRKTGRLTMADGLSSNSITSIAEDDNHQIWVGTANGLNRLKWINGSYSIVQYSESDGMVSNNINERAIYKLKNGNLLVGTPEGYSIIIPQNIVSNNYNGVVHLTDLVSPLPAVMDQLHLKSMESTYEISLPEGSTSVVARFSTLDFSNKGQISYYLRVNEGKDWVKMNGNEINATLLPEGDYKLEVKASNANGDFSPNVKTIIVHVYPPFYRTKWAYLIYALIGSGLLYIAISYIRNRRKKRLQREAIRNEAERQKKMMDMKLQFFANVSHELRTPLTLIINPLEEFMSKHPQYQNSLLSTVNHNANYLLELINQLLDFRKLDATGENISYMHCDIVALVRDQFQSFDSLAKQRDIEYTLETSKSEIMMDCDYDKIRKIVINIISNAFKFTPVGGKIHVGITTNTIDSEQWVTLQFQDSGSGIETDQREKIFNCFYQIESQDHSQGGSGIGLYLVKQYVDMHHGTITVSDNNPCGTVFNIQLPLRAKLGTEVQIEQPSEKVIKNTAETSKNDNYTILVVDDNLEFLNFLTASISTQYNVLKATNGQEALQILEQENVDLVISDVMMPVVDGLQLCQSIKSNINTSHIPVILLTARVGDDYQVEGLTYGADDYITKPFSMEILKLRVKRMLENNLKRQEQFEREVKIEPSKITITPLDQQFIQKAVQVVEDNFENPDFSVEMLAEQLNLSRGHLYKKLSKITGKNPIDFIRVIRMKRAQQLLQESQLQVSEIAYKLGYNSPKLFTKHFKETFNMTPTEYAAKWK